MVPSPRGTTSMTGVDVQASQQQPSPLSTLSGGGDRSPLQHCAPSSSSNENNNVNHSHPLHSLARFVGNGISHHVQQWRRTKTRQQQRSPQSEKGTSLSSSSSSSNNTSSSGLSRSKSLQSLGEIGATLFSPLEGPFESVLGDKEQASSDSCDSLEIPSRHSNVGVMVDDDDQGNDDDDEQQVFLLEDGTELESPYLLTMDMMKQLRQAMPTSTQLKLWKRLYSLSRDGDVFTTFLNAVATNRQTLLVILTRTGEVFGGFAEAHWGKLALRTDGSYHGTGRSFLYSINTTNNNGKSSPLLASSPSSVIPSSTATTAVNDGTIDHDDDDDVVTIYPWQGVNEYSILCSTRNGGMLAMGGGGKDASFGFCVQEFFSKGSSGPCATFGNKEPLSSMPHFDIVDFEVYGFVHNW